MERKQQYIEGQQKTKKMKGEDSRMRKQNGR